MNENKDQGDSQQATPGATPNAEAAAPHGSAQSANPLAAAMDALKAEVADLKDRLLRAHAEMDNIRKRTDREKTEAHKYAVTKFARDIVTVGDNFQRAISTIPPAAAEQDGPLKSLVEGVSMTERELINALERHGIKRMDAMGELFDPHRHQAVMEQQNDQVPSGTIVQVFQSGYLIEDRVLRPAMVVVAKGGFKPAKSPQSGDGATAGMPANDDQPGSNGTQGS